MKKIVCSFLLSAFIMLAGTANTFAQEVSQTDMEDILITQFHKQITYSIKTAYNLRFPQFEEAKIVTIHKEALPEPSEEMKPGTIYEIKIKVKVLNVPREDNSLVITLSNDHARGDFVVKEAKKE
ncbi:hypothetical protein QYG89_06580 [Bacillus sp. B190/17]|uniref:DUF3888 domain-containing protein n=1 Tax=Bacillus lumedeiriae TaxID=3058829 RepID=A0ABW8I7C7_9BACI